MSEPTNRPSHRVYAVTKNGERSFWQPIGGAWVQGDGWGFNVKLDYRPSIDTVFMPPLERFIDAASYYSCLGHETGHATGAKHRLDRDLTGRFGSAKYAMDEVIVEFHHG